MGLNELIIHPWSGLGSRMRAVASGRWAADHLGLDYKIIWQPNNECNCHFSDLFKSSIVSVDEKYLENLCRLRILPRRSFKLERSKLTDRKNSGTNTYILPNTMVPADGSVCIETNARFHPENIDVKNYLIEYRQILKEIFVPSDRVIQRFVELPEKVIGVHVRRGNAEDNTTNSARMAIKAPDSLFTSRMKKALKRGEAEAFYLAADSEETRTKFKRLFGDKVITRNVSERNTIAGVVDALADIILLSRTKRIIGSGWSAYSVMASDYGDTPIELIS